MSSPIKLEYTYCPKCLGYWYSKVTGEIREPKYWAYIIHCQKCHKKWRHVIQDWRSIEEKKIEN